MTETHKINDGQEHLVGPCCDKVTELLGQLTQERQGISAQRDAIAREREARKKAEAGAAEMRSALEGIKDALDSCKFGESYDFPDYGEKALSSDAGKAMLERMERLEKALKYISKIGVSESMPASPRLWEIAEKALREDAPKDNARS